jgi:hypothetical protein
VERHIWLPIGRGRVVVLAHKDHVSTHRTFGSLARKTTKKDARNRILKVNPDFDEALEMFGKHAEVERSLCEPNRLLGATIQTLQIRSFQQNNGYLPLPTEIEVCGSAADVHIFPVFRCQEEGFLHYYSRKQTTALIRIERTWFFPPFLITKLTEFPLYT